MQPPSRKSRPDTCLVVEDNAFDQQMMSRAVVCSGHAMQVVVAGTLKAARETLGQGTIRLILLENSLPDGLGANFVLELASDPRFAHIPVIMFSDWPSPFMWDKAAAAGVACLVSKSEFGARHVNEALCYTRSRQRVI